MIALSNFREGVVKHIRYFAFIGLMGVLSACAPKLPTSGTPTIYDGQWAGEMPGYISDCQGYTVKFDVRYGHILGILYRDGARKADFWGEILPNGQLNAKVGQAGIVGAEAEIQFQDNSGKGTWNGKYCKGNVDVRRVGM